MLPHTHTTLARPAQVWTALSLVYILWGSTYLGIAVAEGVNQVETGWV